MQEWKPWDTNSFHFASPDTVHVWLIHLPLPEAILQQLKHLLSDDELERAARFRFEKHRQRFISARGQLRLLLSAYTGQKPERLTFTYNRFGKPALRTDHSLPAIQFNISHSHELALMAFHPQWELGVDIEWIPPEFDGLHLVKRFFSQNENEQMARVPEALKKEAFFNGWTRKEAYIKARGRGLNIPLAKFSVSIAPDDAVRMIETSHDPNAVQEWSLQNIPINKNYKAAIVVHSRHFNIHLWHGENLEKLLTL